MNWQLFISLRYLFSKPKEKFISLISLISILGVSIGVAALIIVLAVMSGFDNELKEKLIGTNAHIVIDSEFGIKPSKEFLSQVMKTDHVVAAAFYMHGQALIQKNENVTGIILKGITPSEETKVNRISTYLKEGSLDFGADGIVIGTELASRFGLKLGDTVTVISPARMQGKDFRVSGIFASGMYEYDSNLAYVDISRAQSLFKVKDLVSGIGIRVDDAFHVSDVKRSLMKNLRYPVTVRTWIDSNKNLLAALKLEKTVMFVILALIVMVACFNIASTLIMTVLEKTRDIGILKAIGSTNVNIMAIFALQGGMIGFLGTGLGASFGCLICWLLKTYKFISLPKDIYYIDKLPVKLELSDVAVVIGSSLIISFLATIYPAYKASRLDPVEALRYE